MVILKFLLIVFVIFYIIILLGRFYLRRIIKKSKDRFEQGRNSQYANNQNQNKKNGKTYVEYQPEEKKNIPENEGEYIDYEEIK